MDLRDKHEWCNNITKYPLSSWDQPFWNKSNISWASLIDLCILSWQWSLEEDYLRGKWKIQRCLFFSLLFVCHFEKWDMIHPLWRFWNGCRWLKNVSFSLFVFVLDGESFLFNLFVFQFLWFSLCLYFEKREMGWLPLWQFCNGCWWRTFSFSLAARLRNENGLFFNLWFRPKSDKYRYNTVWLLDF